MGHVFRTEEQQAAVDGLRRFLDAEIDPVFSKQYRDQFVPRDRMADIMRRLTEFGLVSGIASEANGGLGLDWLTSLMLFEEVATTSADLSVPVLINSFGVVLLEKVAPAHLRERYLPGLLSGDSFVSMGISEPDVGSNVLEIRTRARRDGDHFIINGEKTWISNGEYSDFLICTCRTSDDPRKGLTHFLLDRKEHPYEVRGIHKIGFNSQSTAQIFLTDVRVPASNMIGNEGEGLRNTLSLFERSRVFVAAQGLGIARRALEEAVRYATERRQHGKVIAGHQLIAAMLAEMATHVDAARLLTYRAASMIEAGVPAEMEAAMAKYFACEAAVKIARQAVQIHGGNGVTTEFLVEKLAREAIVTPIPEGTTQIQQLIIGRALTGVPAF
ncbi:acyl-CoA dehydrogenase [Burkholderia sp. MSh2]|uniref:Acyl-CoA dehydrogenase n=1 Tax=Burkholderia paludis TaxID=1506587 RepID=A0A6J5EWC1_9BURK|nr:MULTISPECIES: acyl-CoA dehydrogenase family protein [Burkholderia]KEZ03627.1 acyl-CoA dehydrogenase [Burkholderia sp. MSh2]KFG97957.1 acyl-CoA dehydrogenase [Burkholderia paludis]CAB3770908.1 Cyclohexane-1-carbonyl-CoA dehydrogenase [Burkholderia paludis]VWC40124.1 acyl-CoA dehydrogenase [Burkholderia paludis]